MGAAGDANRSVRFTRQRIRTVFFSLLQEKSLHKITVAEIVRRTDISRATFYLHYTDIYDLVRKTEDDIIAQVIREIENFDEDNYVVGEFPIAIKTFAVLMKYGKEMELLIGKNGDVNFMPLMQKALHDYFYNLLQPIIKEQAKLELVLSFLIGGVLTMFFENLKSENPQDVHTLAMVANRYLRATNKLIGLPELEPD